MAFQWAGIPGSREGILGVSCFWALITIGGFLGLWSLCKGVVRVPACKLCALALLRGPQLKHGPTQAKRKWDRLLGSQHFLVHCSDSA